MIQLINKAKPECNLRRMSSKIQQTHILQNNLPASRIQSNNPMRKKVNEEIISSDKIPGYDNWTLKSTIDDLGTIHIVVRDSFSNYGRQIGTLELNGKFTFSESTFKTGSDIELLAHLVLYTIANHDGHPSDFNIEKHSFWKEYVDNLPNLRLVAQVFKE